MKVSQILSRKSSAEVATIQSDITVADAVNELAKRRIGALVVVDKKGKMAGIVSERDIVRTLATEGAAMLGTPVSGLMTKTVETCEPDEITDSVLDRMTRGRFRHMPVMADGKLTGIVSIGDVVKARIDEIEHENRAMADMLSQ